MENIEFFNVNDETWFRKENGKCGKFDEKCSELINEMFGFIADNYSDCHKALLEYFRRSKPNIAYYKFLVVRKFIRCNFGEIDNVRDIDREKIYNMEHVACPLRGECKWENIICHPQHSTNLSKAESRVMKMVCKGMSTSEIAERLFVTYNTVKKHMANAYRKTGVAGKSEFIVYAGRRKLWTKDTIC